MALLGFLGLLELREGLLSFTFRLALGLFFAFALALSLPVMQFAMRDQLLYKFTKALVALLALLALLALVQSLELWFAEHLHALKSA